MTCLQFLALFTVNLLFVPLEETPFIIPPAAVLPAAYLGIVSIFIGHTLQIICQEKVDSTKAAVLLSLEGVFGSIFSAILLGERYRLPALAGLCLFFYQFCCRRQEDASGPDRARCGETLNSARLLHLKIVFH